MKSKPHPEYQCTECERTFKQGASIRRHFRSAHSDIDMIDLEVSMFLTRHPNQDFDLMIADYLDEKTSVFSLKNEGMRLGRLFNMIGIRRKYHDDLVVQRKILHGSASIYDNPNWRKSMMEKYGVENANDLEAFNDKKIMSHLKRDGLEGLFEARKVIRKVKNYRRNKAKEAREAAKIVDSTTENTDNERNIGSETS